MKAIPQRYYVLVLAMLSIGLNASSQQSFSTVGADVINEGGSVSYTVGQTLYTCDLGVGSTTYGAQQSYRRCVGDYDGDGVVNALDLLQLLVLFNCDGLCPGDLTGDGDVNTADLLYFLSLFGNNCSP
jgi:hypothetical protein